MLHALHILWLNLRCAFAGCRRGPELGGAVLTVADSRMRLHSCARCHRLLIGGRYGP